MTEIQLQAACFQWAWNTYPSTRGLLFHIPNGGSRNAIEGMQLKASGVVAGIPDLVLTWVGHAYGFELKTETGTVSTVQEKIHQIWINNGTPVYIIRSLEQFQLVFTDIISSTSFKERRAS